MIVLHFPGKCNVGGLQTQKIKKLQVILVASPEAAKEKSSIAHCSCLVIYISHFQNF